MADLTAAVALVGKDEASGPIGAVERALHGLEGAASAPISAVGKLVSALGAIGLAKQGIDAIASAATGLGSALGVGLASEMENVRAQIMAFTKDGTKTAQILGDIRSEADKTPFSFQAMSQAVAGLIPSANSAKVPLMDLVRQAEILAASHPEQGLQGAAFALREAMSGDFTSIVERFDLPRQYINQLKEQGVPNMEIVRRGMAAMGYDMSLVANLAGTTSGRFSTFQDAIDGLRVKAGEPILAALGTQLDRLSGFIDQNQAPLSALATLIGNTLAGGIETGAQAAMRLLDVTTRVQGVFEATGGSAEDLQRAMGSLAFFVGEDAANAILTAVRALQGDFSPALTYARDRVADAQAAMSAFAPTGERLGQVIGFVGDRVRDLLPHAQTMATRIEGVASAAGGAEGAVQRVADVVNGMSATVEAATHIVQEHQSVQVAIAGVLGGTATALTLMAARALAVQVATIAVSVATQGYTAAQIALNFALTANPIGLVIVALGALAAAVIYLWNTNEGFREGVTTAWAAVSAAVGTVVLAVGTKVNELAAFLGTLPERFRQDAIGTGLAIVEGIVIGLLTGPGRVWQAAWDLGKKALEAARAAVDSHSPSKEAEKIGDDFVAGLVDGIDASASDAEVAVTDAMEGVVAATVTTFDEAASAIGASFERAMAPLERVQAEVQEKLEDAQRAHGYRVADLERELGGAKVKERQAILERIADEERRYSRQVEGINESSADRLVQLEREQAQRRGQALREFMRDVESATADYQEKSRRAAEDASRAITEAIASAASSRQEAIDRAQQAVQDATEGLGLSRITRGRRDAFSDQQSEEARIRQRQLEDADFMRKRIADLATLEVDQKKATGDLKKRRDREDADDDYQLHQDLERAKTDEERERIHERFDAHREDLQRRRQQEDKDREERAAADRQALKDRQLAEEQALNERRAREDADRQFRKQQAEALQAFNDALENEALNRQINRITTERDSRIAEINAALAEKQRKIEEQAAAEQATLAESYRHRIEDLKAHLIEKIGPLMGEAQTTIQGFLNGIGTSIQSVIQQAMAAAAAIANISSRPATASGGTTSGGGGGGTITNGGSTQVINQPSGTFTPTPGGTYSHVSGPSTSVPSGGDQTGNSAPGTCFVAGTQILTPDGQRPIESLCVGDLVLSWDFTIAALVPTPVSATFIHEESATLTLRLANGALVVTTPEHPLYVAGEWREAGTVTAGQCLTMAGEAGLNPVRVLDVWTGAPTTVFNVEVAHPDHTYVAGGVLVHNKLAEGGIMLYQPGGVPNIFADRPPGEAAIPLDGRGASFMRNVWGLNGGSGGVSATQLRQALEGMQIIISVGGAEDLTVAGYLRAKRRGRI